MSPIFSKDKVWVHRILDILWLSEMFLLNPCGYIESQSVADKLVFYCSTSDQGV